MKAGSAVFLAARELMELGPRWRNGERSGGVRAARCVKLGLAEPPLTWLPVRGTPKRTGVCCRRAVAKDLKLAELAPSLMICWHPAHIAAEEQSLTAVTQPGGAAALERAASF